jgi:hypothetical protein
MQEYGLHAFANNISPAHIPSSAATRGMICLQYLDSTPALIGETVRHRSGPAPRFSPSGVIECPGRPRGLVLRDGAGGTGFVVTL